MIDSRGCKIDPERPATVTESVVTGTVAINGKCYPTVSISNRTSSFITSSFIPMGTITIGQCYNRFKGGCQPEHCSSNSPGKRCNEQIPECTQLPHVGPAICYSTYFVQEGDTWGSVAIDHQMRSVETLQWDNPGVGDALQPGQELCVDRSTRIYLGFKSACEGFKVRDKRLAGRKMQQLAA